MTTRMLEPREYYRLPWSLTDNGLSWLEVTTKCNLACKGCYRDPHKDGHKSLDEIARDLEVFAAKRRSDSMSIAGGDPLVHPDIVEIVRMIRRKGWKPVLNTNGLALTPELLKELKAAGVYGFTFHVDTTQKRMDSPDAVTEADHNPLRQKFAEMVAAEGGIGCSFNQTVSERTLDQVPEVVRWGIRRPDLVHTMVFILYREPSMARRTGLSFFANGREIDMGVSYDDTDFCGGRPLKAQDVVDQIRTVVPGFEPSAYLNGTVDPDSMKWLMGIRLADGEETFGHVSARYMETVQNVSHLFRDRWLSYVTPNFLGLGRSSMALFSPIDGSMRRAMGRYLSASAKSPGHLLRKVRMQTFTIIQAVDFLPDGSMNMCDGCPDITVHDGKLYWSCRLEEIKEHGTFVSAYPANRSHRA